jgi:hypothetical protein
MSYLNQNYFNNFQVRNPILKNPVNRNVPLQLVKTRPAELQTLTAAASTGSITVENVNCGALRVNPASTVSIYYLPPAYALIDLLGVQSNGLPTPTYSNCVQQGDVLILPVINNNTTTGCTIVADSSSTGSLVITPASGFGEVSQLVIDFTNISSVSYGVTGSYEVYGCAC